MIKNGTNTKSNRFIQFFLEEAGNVTVNQTTMDFNVISSVLFTVTKNGLCEIVDGWDGYKRIEKLVLVSR